MSFTGNLGVTHSGIFIAYSRGKFSPTSGLMGTRALAVSHVTGNHYMIA
jgi:hypothetical protein